MSSDSEHVFPSSRARSPPTSPYTSPLKRPLQESSAETPRRRCRPPPTPSFANEFASLSRLEYGGNDTTSEVGQDQDLCHSFHLTQLKRSTLHLEKCWVKQKIEEHEITLQALKEWMSNIEENITSTTFKVDRLHCCMDRLGISIPDMPDLIAASIFLSEVINMDTVKIPKTLSAYTTMRDRLFTLDFLNFPALDSRHAARECESNWLQHQIDYLFRPRDYLHAQSYGELCAQTPASHLSDVCAQTKQWSGKTALRGTQSESRFSTKIKVLIVRKCNNLTFKWHTLAAAIWVGLLSDPMDPNAISMSGYDPDGDEDEFLAEINQTLEAEIRQDVSVALQGWSTYRLLRPLELRKAHHLPTTANEFHCMVSMVLTALDTGAATHDGETMVKGLTPQSWMRLVMATLSAVLRGALRSPASLRSGSRSLNGIDTFPLHTDLDHPLTEGGAIMLMCQQLGGLYASNRNHPDKSYPDSYFDRLITLLDSRMHQVRAAVQERLILAGLETARVDENVMAEIREAVKAEIFANMNAEALQNIDDWRALYKFEFTEAMHAAFEAQYPGIHPNKGKARANPPITLSQVVRDAQPHIQEEIKLQVEARVANIHNEVKASIANNDPFWGEGPIREAIANDIRMKVQAEVQHELEADIEALKVTSADELDAFKFQLQFEQEKAHNDLHAQAKAEYEQAKQQYAANLEADLQDFKTAISTSVKEWKDTYQVSQNLAALRREACRFGFNVVPIDEGSTATEKSAFQKYSLPPIEIDGRDLSAEPESALSVLEDTPTPFLTPINLPRTLPDPNVTPTPTCTKRPRTGDPALYPPVEDSLFSPNSPPRHTRPPRAPHHLPRRTTPTEQKREDPIPVALTPTPPRLEVPSPAPQAAAGADLVAVLAAINTTIAGLESRLSDRLDAQDRRIDALITPVPPPTAPSAVKGKQAKGKEAVAAPPRPNTSSTPSAARKITGPVPRIDDPASHDP
ncbi:hypothetical protein EDB86DRAFT_2838302, partial [Lactarius hatsudake]